MEKRDSNIELLRLICMFFIVFHHILVHGACPELLDDGAVISTVGARIALFLNGLFFPAVNIFILISGYYGIKTSFKKFFNLYIFCGFYGLINYIVHIILTDQQLGPSLVIKTFMPFSHYSYWFIPCYCALMCFAPILEKFIKAADKKEYFSILLMLTFINVYLGFIWENDLINPDGYTAMQLLYMYVIGGYIRKFVNIKQCKVDRWKHLSIFVSAAIVYSLLCLFTNRWGSCNYNNPLTVIGAIAFFLFVVSFNFQSKSINYLASSALAVYLIQSASCFEALFYPWIKQVQITFGIVSFLIFIAVSFIIVVTCCLIDKIRVVIMKPVWAIYYKFSQNREWLQ